MANPYDAFFLRLENAGLKKVYEAAVALEERGPIVPINAAIANAFINRLMLSSSLASPITSLLSASNHPFSVKVLALFASINSYSKPPSSLATVTFGDYGKVCELITDDRDRAFKLIEELWDHREAQG
ncbi:MAG: hypothetical protein WCT31_04020, partial [Candidatus Micrarchaeia archaeon]